MVTLVFNRGINSEWTEEFATNVAAKAALVYELRELCRFTEEKSCENDEFSTYDIYDGGTYGEVYRWTRYGDLIDVPYRGEVRA